MIEKPQLVPEQIRELLRLHPKGLTITEIATNIKINRNSTARYLDVLQVLGQIEMRQIGPAKIYTLSHRVPSSALLNLTHEGILVYDASFKILQVNDTFSAMFDVPSDRLIGEKLSSLSIPIFKRSNFLDGMKKALSGEQESFELEAVQNETTLHLHMKIVPTTFNDGSIGATIIVEDVSDSKNAELQIKQQNDFLNLVMESVAHPFYVIDANDYTIKMANKAARLGFAPEGSTCHVLTHRSAEPCSGDVHPCPLKEVKSTRMPVVVEHTHHHVSGSTKYLEIHAHPIFDGRGNVVQMVEYNLDVTERKQIEAELHHSNELHSFLLDAVDDAVLMLQYDEIVFCNAGFSIMVGIEKEKAVGKMFKDFVTKGNWDEVARMIESRTSSQEGGDIVTHHILNNGKPGLLVTSKFIPAQYLGEPAMMIIMKRETT
ncbi:MAG: PAS domain-containing protein [Candidatus Thorarchaeota archaeon]